MEMDVRRIAVLSEMAEADEDVALQLESERTLSGEMDEAIRFAELDAIADRIAEKQAFQVDEVEQTVDLVALAGDAGF